MASLSGVRIKDCLLRKELDGMRILSPSGRGVTIPAKGYFIDREAFDRHYLRLAEKAGVALLSGEVRSLHKDGSERRVGLEGEEIHARVVIDASGVASGLSEQAGLKSMRHPEDIAWALEADIEYPYLGEEMFFQYWVGSMAPGWKATFSPAGGDLATLGVFVRGHGRDVQPFFDRFKKLFQAQKASQYRNIDRMKVLSIRRGGDPICVMPGEMTADSLMVTGGAAGQSGLAYSMRAGTICGTVAAEAIHRNDVSFRSLSEYARRWKREFYWQYRMGRSSLLTLGQMRDEEIERLILGLSGKGLVSKGSFIKKAVYAGAKVSMIRPRTPFDLLINLMRG
jgi:digeranylgeranylglycerophospholipid reductase